MILACLGHGPETLIELLDSEIPEAVGLAFFAMVLDADNAGSIFVIFNVSGDDSVDFNLEVVALAGDAVGIPVVAFEGIASALTEGGFTFFITAFRADEPLSAALIIQAARPVAWGAINFSLVTEDFIRFDVSAEHEAAIRSSFGEENIALEDKIRVGLFGDEEKFLISGEVEFAIDDFDFPPFVWIFPTVGCFTIEELGPLIFFSRGFFVGGFWLITASEEEGGTGKSDREEGVLHGGEC